MNRRVAVTGIGVVAPGGTGTKEFWSLITSGRTATGPLTAFDATPYRSRIAAQCAFDPLAAGFSPREVRRLDRAALFAVACTREALADAGLASGTPPVPERTGVSLGTAVGCTTSLENEYAVVSDGGRDWLVDHRHAVPQLVDYLVPSSLAREVAWAADALGPAAVISAGCTSGLDAVGHACEIIREGTADVMLTGGTDAPISPSPSPPSTPSGRPPRATTTRRPPRGRSTAPGTASSWVRAPPCWCWRSGRTPWAGVRTSTPR